MIPVTELRSGATFELDGEPYIVVNYHHTKLGRGNATIRVKIRHLINGSVIEKSFVSGTRVSPVQTRQVPLQYLYKDGDDYFFMDKRTFEQYTLSDDLLGEKAIYLKEGEDARVLFWEEKPLGIEIPNSLVYTVVEAPPGVKGDTVSGSLKQVTLGNGIVAKVPLFIREGDKIKIDTRTGAYVERIT